MGAERYSEGCRRASDSRIRDEPGSRRIAFSRGIHRRLAISLIGPSGTFCHPTRAAKTKASEPSRRRYMPVSASRRASRPVSSRTSRRAAIQGVSSDLIPPPGSAHFFCPRGLTTRTWSRRRMTANAESRRVMGAPLQYRDLSAFLGQALEPFLKEFRHGRDFRDRTGSANPIFYVT